MFGGCWPVTKLCSSPSVRVRVTDPVEELGVRVEGDDEDEERRMKKSKPKQNRRLNVNIVKKKKKPIFYFNNYYNFNYIILF